MLPVIAIVGRPNVGKSTLFNYLTQSRAALVADQPGVTRDRQYGEGSFNERRYIVIDTGGLDHKHAEFQDQISQQTWAAVEEADIIFWLVDGRSGLTAQDEFIAAQLRRLSKTIYLLVNKTDGRDAALTCAEFYALGITPIAAIAATQGRGVNAILEQALAKFPTPEEVLPDTESGIKVAIVGKPNVGKSTLVNRILGEERVLVYDAPGTTRDSIFIPFERRGKHYTLIDTAGVRRRRSVKEDTLEKFSVVKTLQAITEANVVVFIIDAREGIAEQDLHLLGYILDSGRALVIAINKWDGMVPDQRQWVEKELDRRLSFVTFARTFYISALHGSGVGELFPAIDEAYHSATRKLTTPKLTEILERALAAHQPPTVSGRRIKLRYAHSGGANPPVIVIHGNQVDALPTSYQRYLANYFRDTLSLKGTPIRIELKGGDNPFKDKKNTLTPRQVKRRQRLIKHVKKK